MEHRAKSASDIFGHIDALKFCSCLTLFNEVSSKDPVFQQALKQFYNNGADIRTEEILKELEPQD